MIPSGDLHPRRLAFLVLTVFDMRTLFGGVGLLLGGVELRIGCIPGNKQAALWRWAGQAGLDER